MATMIIKTQFVSVSDDLEVAYRRWGSDRFGRVPLVAVHGDWSTSAVWTRLAGELTERWILAPDLRGRGLTRGPDHGYSIAELANDLQAFIDTMQLSRLHLLGHGLGAAVVAELARRRPEGIASLIMVALPWVDGMPEQLARRDLPQFYKDNPREFSNAIGELAPKAARDMLWAGLSETGHKQRISAALGTIDALQAWQPGDALAGLRMNRCIIDGQRDELHGGEVAARAARACACPRQTIPEAGHLVQLDDPEGLAEAIRNVIAKVEGVRL